SLWSNGVSALERRGMVPGLLLSCKYYTTFFEDVKLVSTKFSYFSPVFFRITSKTIRFHARQQVFTGEGMGYGLIMAVLTRPRIIPASVSAEKPPF
ncbi:MAG: hypothetical protein IKP09_00820, partial [Lentisphaeria bacterium]|nr:hypothetical protein [Lentisphaeria bacterium]